MRTARPAFIFAKRDGQYAKSVLPVPLSAEIRSAFSASGLLSGVSAIALVGALASPASLAASMTTQIRMAATAAAGCALSGTLFDGTITASLIAEGWGTIAQAGGTVEGPAPLIVRFDSVDTVHANPSINTFRQVGYHFDYGYGNPSYATHAATGLPMGRDIGGPLAGHCYRTPGSYTATVRAQDSAAVTSDKQVTIVAQDPAVVYAGAATVCISKAGDFTGAPIGASLVTTVPASAASNTRYLFRCGEDYSANTLSIAHSRTKIQVGSFGSGAKPKVRLSMPQFPPTNSQTMFSCATVIGCDVNRMEVKFGNYISYVDCTGWNITANDTIPAAVGTTVNYYYNNPPSNTTPSNSKWPRCSAWINCDIDGKFISDYGMYGMLYHAVVIDSYMHGSNQHDSRYPIAYRSFIGHNRYGALANDTKAQIKLHGGSGGTIGDGPAVTGSPESRFNVIKAPFVEADANAWQIAVQPQNNESNEYITDVIIEYAVFEAGGGGNGSQRAVVLGGKRLCVRELTVGARTATTHIGYDTHMAATDAEQHGPYYLPAGSQGIGNGMVFANDATIEPGKAGT